MDNKDSMYVHTSCTEYKGYAMDPSLKFSMLFMITLMLNVSLCSLNDSYMCL